MPLGRQVSGGVLPRIHPADDRARPRRRTAHLRDHPPASTRIASSQYPYGCAICDSLDELVGAINVGAYAKYTCLSVTTAIKLQNPASLETHQRERKWFRDPAVVPARVARGCQERRVIF